MCAGVLVALACEAAVAAAEPCPPAALVDGDAEAVGPVQAALVARGVEVSVRPGCPASHARVRRQGAHLVVDVEDAYGRLSQRTVADAATAAAVIESWTRADVSAGLLAAPPAPAPQVREDEAPAVLRVPAPVAPARSIGLGARLVTALTSDGSLLLGLETSACVQMGPTCVGVLARASVDSQQTGPTERMENSRTGLDVLVGADVPLRAGSLTIVPGAGLGLGWLRTGGTGVPAGGDDAIDVDGGGPRAEARVALSLPLARGWALDFGVAADVALLAHTSAFNVSGTTLAGEPRGYFWGGIGVRHGGP